MSQNNSHFDDLERLASLKKRGLITQQDYDTEKQQILDKINGPNRGKQPSVNHKNIATNSQAIPTQQKSEPKKPKQSLNKNRWYGKGAWALLGLITLPYFVVYMMMVDHKRYDGKWYVKGWGAFWAYVFLPVFAIWFIWKEKSYWSKAKKVVLSIPHAVWLGIILLIIVAGIMAPPTVELSSIKENEVVRVEGSKYKFSGKIYPTSSQVTINNNSVSLNSTGNFEYDVELNEGENQFTVKAVDGDKITEKTYKVYRFTSAELADKRRKEQDAQNKNQPKQAVEIPKQHNPEDYWHQVTQVVDGDTVKARIDGQEQSIRIIGIDAPESTTQKECYGPESSAKAKEFLGGKWIKIKADKTQDDKDKYGRLLRYVYFDQGTDFAKRMIEEGHAYEYTYSVAYKNQALYKSMQDSAKGASRGLWSAETCSGQKVKPAPAATIPVPAATPAPRQPTPAPTPTPAPAPSSVYYANCDEARAAGVAPIYQGQPGYRAGLDRDKDGIACDK